jgi:small-conductance mechanosensitive channel
MPQWKEIAAFAERAVFNNTIFEWLVAAGIAILLFVLLRLAKALLVYRTRKLAERFDSETGRSMVDILASTRSWFLMMVAIYAASLTLDVMPKVTHTLRVLTIVLLLIQAAIWGTSLINLAIARYVRSKMETDAASVTTIAALGFLGRVAMWAIVVLLALENLGVDVTALVAGLGVGGVAVALAAQNILGDLFSSLSIVLDKPFVLGDSIAVGADVGTVEKIGLKTTRLRSVSGELLVFSNSDLLQSRIRNFKRMYERRVLFSVGVTYQTPYDKLAAIPGMLREAVESQAGVRFDRAHLKELGGSSINFEVVYFMLTPDYLPYMDTQQAINLWLVKTFATQAIELAYPTQTLYINDNTPRTEPRKA